MPIYEYTCLSCRRRVNVFFRSLAAVEANPQCPRCGERRLERRMSRVWSHAPARSIADVGDTDPGSEWTEGWDGDYSGEQSADDFDPVTFAREARQMANAMGEPIDAEFDSALRHIESGADPEDVFGDMDSTADDSPER